MKKTLWCTIIALCLALLCQTALAATDSRLPAQVNEILSGPSWSGYDVTQTDDLSQWGARDTVAAILSKGERNVLCVFSKSSGSWKLVVKREKALYAGDQEVRLQFPDEQHFVIYYEFGERAEDYWFKSTAAGKESWRFEKARLWRNRKVNPNTGDVTAEIVEVTPTQDGLAYRGYHFESDKADVQTSDRATVSGVIYTDLDAFNIYTFPKSFDEAKRKLSQPPSLPASAREDALPQGTTGEFEMDRRYPVYSGPAESYVRPANGKAAVSTNDWIQVFGREDGMVLIQYAISSDKARFGYIASDALKREDSVQMLEFVFEPVTLVSAAAMTDDPLFSKETVAQLNAGEQVQYLASFGEDWAYIETLAAPQMRGFIPSVSIGFQN